MKYLGIKLSADVQKLREWMCLSELSECFHIAFDDRKKEDYLIIQTIFVSVFLAHLRSLYYPLVNKYWSVPVGLRSTHSFF